MKNIKMVLWLALIVAEMLFLGCNKKAEAQENSKTFYPDGAQLAVCNIKT